MMGVDGDSCGERLAWGPLPISVQEKEGDPFALAANRTEA